MAVILMYNSIKQWMNIPVTIKRFNKRDGTGAITFLGPVDSKCYVDGKVQVITNSLGVEVISTRQLYVDGSTEIAELDNVIFEGKELPVKGVSTFYENGLPDLKVVYI